MFLLAREFRKFLRLAYDCVITNIDWDHPDCFPIGACLHSGSLALYAEWHAIVCDDPRQQEREPNAALEIRLSITICGQWLSAMELLGHLPVEAMPRLEFTFQARRIMC